MTEDEAKTKWCPFARVDNTASNRPDATGSFNEAGWPPCVASACMAWRTVAEERHTGLGSLDKLDYERGAGGWRFEDTRGSGYTAIRGGGGFCGLAGRPE